jgi:hypothetical protein
VTLRQRTRDEKRLGSAGRKNEEAPVSPTEASRLMGNLRYALLTALRVFPPSNPEARRWRLRFPWCVAAALATKWLRVTRSVTRSHVTATPPAGCSHQTL